MTTLPEPLESRLLDGAGDENAELVPGQRECEEYMLSRRAYDPRYPETEARMMKAFRRFHELGYEAYFQGLSCMPMAIASQACAASMWTTGFHAAHLTALARRCDCQCSRQYQWGIGYTPCPRRRQALTQKVSMLTIVMQS
jgi:hypothetical protein